MKTFLVSLVLVLGMGSLAQAQSVDPRDRTLVRCHTLVSTATTLTALTGCAAVTGQSYYVTDVIFGTSVVTSTAADSQLTLKYGTGGTCGTGTTVFWSAMALASTTVVTSTQAPIRIPRGNELCWIASPAGTKSVTVLGYLDK